MSKLSKGLKKVERAIGGLIPHQSAYDKRQSMYAAREQMDLYQQQKQMLQEENERIGKQKDLERQKLHEKQIRALRRNYRSPGFMQQPAQNELSDTLG